MEIANNVMPKQLQLFSLKGFDIAPAIHPKGRSYREKQTTGVAVDSALEHLHTVFMRCKTAVSEALFDFLLLHRVGSLFLRQSSSRIMRKGDSINEYFSLSGMERLRAWSCLSLDAVTYSAGRLQPEDN